MLGKWRSINKGEWIMLLIVGGFVALMLAATLWMNYINAAPEIIIPPEPPPPNPNAYDFYRRAASAIRVPTYRIIHDEIRQWDWPAPPPPARPKYRIVGFSVTKKGRVAQYVATPPPTLAAAERTLHANAMALGIMRQGFAFPCRVNPGPSNPAEELKKLLMVSERTHAARGRWAAGVGSYLDIVHLGADLLQGRTSDALAHDHDDMLWRKPAWVILPLLDAAEARAAIRRLNGIITERPAFGDLVQEDRRRVLRIIAITFARPDWRDRPELIFISKRQLLRDHMQVLDRLVEYAGQPYARHASLPAVPLKIADLVGISSLVAEIRRYRLHYANDVAQDGLLLIALALQAYRQEHGTYPQRLAQLCPGYLKALPDDPFALQGTFRYRTKGKGYLLFSLGPDGKDDGGTPVALKTAQGMSYTLSEKGLGDAVAGVNLSTE